MSEIKALDKLRECAELAEFNCGQLVELVDEIQAEIEANYMELPKDADDAPIHVGDVMEYENPNDENKPFTVLGVNNSGDVFHCLEDRRLVPTCISVGLRHVKPRTLEDVLRDVWKEALDYAKSDIWRNPDEVFAEHADEIRELLGSDA